MVGALTLGATIAMATPASAEGSWSSYISGWSGGEESRRWQDSHNDSASTTVQFSGCNFHGGSVVALDLARVQDLLPDVSYGTKNNTCNTVSWGEVKTSGRYYFTYLSTHSLDVSDVITRY
ncbi:hypothetical protein ACFVT5_37825 [Streptomyces sp. NPDC058001]|uniref:hypothetical protein n=1 Tax=Streptomyces sp. NPDC058001 TaxID=3346300 RepID=UPI0036E1D062